MELLPYDSLMTKLKQKRRSVETTQKEIAHRAGISPAQLSRMETGNAEAKYSTVYRVWEVLEQAETGTEETAGQLCTGTIAWVTTAETGRDAKYLMLDNNYSQVPVRDADTEQVVGSLTDRALMEAEELHSPIHELMSDPFLEVRSQTSRSAVVELLRDDNDAVLVRDSEGDAYVGIITPADII